MASKRDKPASVRVAGVPLAADREALAQAAVQLRRRARPTLRERIHRVRFNLILALQAGIAAALSYVIAVRLLKNPDPVFASITAVGTLASSVGQRFRRTIELIIGVTIGIAIGDIFIYIAGIGPWQLGVIVITAIIITIFLGGGPAVVTQAAVTALLLMVLKPKTSNLEFPRVIDALVGGFVALGVGLLLLPFNPLRVVDRAARPALEALATELDVTAKALAGGDPDRAQAALDRVQEVEAHMQGLQEALEGGRETAAFAPVHWNRRGALTQYVEGARYIEHAVANSGTLIRRAVTALEDQEPIPPTLPAAVAQLADAVRQLLSELGAGVEPDATRERALRAVREAGRAYSDGVGFSGSVVVAQLRTTASDLLRASGIERVEANKLVRHAVDTGKSDPAHQARTGEPAPPSPEDPVTELERSASESDLADEVAERPQPSRSADRGGAAGPEEPADRPESLRSADREGSAGPDEEGGRPEPPGR